MRLASLFLIFLALRTLSTRRSQNQKPPSQSQKILRLLKNENFKRDSDTIFEFDFGMDIDKCAVYDIMTHPQK